MQPFIAIENAETQTGEIHHISKAGAAPPSSLGITLSTSHWLTRPKIAAGTKLFSECFMPKTKAHFSSKEKKKINLSSKEETLFLLIGNINQSLSSGRSVGAGHRRGDLQLMIIYHKSM